MKLIIVFFSMLFSLNCIAQNNLTGYVTDSAHTPIVGATAIMLNAEDSTYIQGVVSEENGSFTMSISNKSFFIVVSCLGYESVTTTQVSSPLMVTLNETSTQLQEISVRAMRPASQLTRDGFLYSIKGTALAQAGNANDILELMPLVKKTSKGFEVIGKGDAVFFVNGRRVYNMSEIDNISSKNVKEVEIIANPGAQYDPAFKAVIKITTSTDFTDGLHIDARSTWHQNRNSSLIEQLNVQYNKKRLTIYDTFKFQLDDDLTWKELNQTVYTTTTWKEISKEQEHKKQTTIANIVGIDYKIASKAFLGVRYSFIFNPMSEMNLGSTNSVYSNSDCYDFLETIGSNKVQKSPAHQINVYCSGSIGKYTIHADVDYINSITESYNHYKESSTTSQNQAFTTNSDIDNELLSVRTSLGQKLWKGDATVGFEYVHTNRDDNYLSDIDEIPTSQSLLKETQISAFFNYSVLTNFGIFGLGVRGEKTRFCYIPGTDAEKESQSSTKVYPNMSWGIRFGGLQAQLSYSTSINRPTYRQLSKNILYGSRYTWQMGNPLLRPEYAHELSLQGVWKFLQFQGSYTDTHDAIINWGTQNESNNAISVMSYKNLPSVKQVRLALVFAHGFGIWNPQLTVAVNKQFLRLDTDMGPFKLNNPIWFTKLSNSFKLSPTCTMFLTTNYQSKGDYRNVHLNRHVWFVNFNLSKSFCKERFNLQLKINDIFNTNKDGNDIYNAKMIMNLLNRYDYRAVSLTFRYQFNKEQSNKHDTHRIDNEIKRL